MMVLTAFSLLFCSCYQKTYPQKCSTVSLCVVTVVLLEMFFSHLCNHSSKQTADKLFPLAFVAPFLVPLQAIRNVFLLLFIWRSLWFLSCLFNKTFLVLCPIFSSVKLVLFLAVLYKTGISLFIFTIILRCKLSGFI